MASAGTATILFTDLVGSTALGDRLGDDKAEEVRRAHFAFVREAVTSSGGEVVKTMGDGHMLVFASALDAIGCAVAIQHAVELHNSDPDNETLQVRIGINAGEVTREGNDYFGTPVNVAARLCDQAQGGQIIVSELVQALVGSRGQFAFKPMRPLQLRGLSQPMPAREVVWRGSDEPSTPVEVGVDRTRSGRMVVIASALVLIVAVVVVALVSTRNHTTTPPPVSAAGATSVVEDPNVTEGRQLLKATGNIATSDASGTHFFTGTAGKWVTVDLVRASPHLDFYIELIAPTGVVVGFDDDSGFASEPQIKAVKLPMSGEYKVVVTINAPPPSGVYTVGVHEAKPAEKPFGPWYGQLVTYGERDSYPVTLDAGKHVTVAGTSDARLHFDAFVELHDRSGKLIASDDNSGLYGEAAIKDFRVPSSGIYTVVMRAVDPTDHGAYRVIVQEI